MATVNGILLETIDNKSDIGTGIAAGDFVAVWDVSAGNTRKVSRANFLGATITGGGAIVTGGFTLTIPATGTAALRDAANTFTAATTFMGNVVIGGSVELQLADYDGGVSYGRRIIVGRNTNASTPAAGYIMLYDKSGYPWRIWPDNTGVLRIGNANPTGALDTSGTVVGAQTSSLDSKDVLEGVTDIEDVLAAVRRGAEAVRRFTYKSGAFGGETFEGVVVDYAPRYGMDADKEHPAGRSLNEINIIGDLLRAVAWLVEREVRRGD